MQFAGLAVKNPVSSMILPHSAPRRRAWSERTASLLLPGADSRPAPAAPRRRSSRRGGLYGRPDRTPTTTRAPGHRGPATAACGHAALRGSTRVRRKLGACSGGHKGRPYAARSTWSVGRGAHTPPEPPGPRSSRPGHGGMGACRPTAFGGSAAKIGGLSGRLLAAPTPHVRPGP